MKTKLSNRANHCHYDMFVIVWWLFTDDSTDLRWHIYTPTKVIHDLLNIKHEKLWLFSKWDTSSRWPFRPNSACGSIETTTTRKTHPTLPACFVNIIFSVIKHIAQKLVDPCFYFFVTVFDLKDGWRGLYILRGWDHMRLNWICLVFFCSVNEVKMSFECKYLFVYVCCMLMSFLSRKMDKWTVLGECQQTHFRLKGVPLPPTRKTLAKALPKRTKEGLCPHLTFGFTFTSSSLCFHTCYQNVNQYFIMINLCWFQSFFSVFHNGRNTILIRLSYLISYFRYRSLGQSYKSRRHCELVNIYFPDDPFTNITIMI